MKERMTIKQLRERLNEIDPEFDDYTVAIFFADREVRDDIVVDFPKDPVLCPTTDKERQGMFMVYGRREYEKMEKKLEEFNKEYEEKYGKKKD